MVLGNRGPTWVVGAGGLLGQALTSALHRNDHGPVITTKIHWNDVEESRKELRTFLSQFLDQARVVNTPWRIAWCAGAE